MKLHSQSFERALRKGVRLAIKQSPALKREFRAANKVRRHYEGMLLARPLVSLILAAVVLHVQETLRQPAAALAAVNLWALAFVSIQSQRMLNCLYSSSDLPVFGWLPFEQETVFRWQLRKFLQGALWLLVDILAACVVLAVFTDFSALKWTLMVPITFLAWVNVLALSVICVTWRPQFPYHLANTGFFILMITILVGRDSFGKPLLGVLDKYGPTLNLVLPTGWPFAVFGTLFQGGDWMFLSLIAPMAGVFWMAWLWLKRIRAGYNFEEQILPEASDLVPATEIPSPDEPELPPEAEPIRLGITSIEEIIVSRQFLASPSWSGRGWTEKLLWNWLSERERNLAEFAFPDGFSITSNWKKIFRNLAISVLAVLGAGFVSATAQWWVLGIALFIIFVHALAQLYAGGRAFQVLNCSGVQIPIYAGVAIGFRELARLLFKISLVQTPFVLVFASLSSVFVFGLLDKSLIDGAEFGLKAGGLLLAGRFLSVVLSFSSGTNDTSRVRLRSTAFLVALLASAFALLGSGAASLFVPQPQIGWPLFGFAWLSGYGFFRVYGWFYNSNRFDLMHPPRQE